MSLHDFRVVDFAAKLILGYLSLKEMGLSVNYVHGNLQDSEGQHFYCRDLVNKSHLEEKKEIKTSLLVVHVKLMKDVPGQKLMKRGSILKVPLCKSLILGQYETRRIFLPLGSVDRVCKPLL